MKKYTILLILLALFLSACDARGGGWIRSTANAKKKATFGFQVKCTQIATDQIKFTGQLEYDDHAAGVKFHADMDNILSGDVYSCSDPIPYGTGLNFDGTYRLMPSRQTGIVRLSVRDEGKSGDSIMIQLFDINGSQFYFNEGKLNGGNLQVR